MSWRICNNSSDSLLLEVCFFVWVYIQNYWKYNSLSVMYSEKYGKKEIASQLSPSRPTALEVIVKLYCELKNRIDQLRYIPRVLHRLIVLNRIDEPLFITQLRSLRITQLFSFTIQNSCLECLLMLHTLITSTLRVEVSSSSYYYSCFNNFPRMD